METIVMALAKGLACRNGKQPPEVTVVTATASGGFDDSSLPFRVVRRPGLLALVLLIRASDVVHIAGPALLPLLAGVLLRRPVVVEHHGFQTICPNGQLLYEPAQAPCPGHFMAGSHLQCVRCNARAGLFESLKLWFLTFPRRWFCKSVSSNITPTEWLSSLLRLPMTTTIQHGLMPTDNGELRAGSSPPAFGFIGRLVGTKGVDVLLRAASRLKSGGLNFTLKIIGDGPERPHLEAQAEDLNLSDRVQFLGYLPDSGLPDALAGVGVVVVPSVGGEVFGLVVLESMMRGILPIVSAGGALAEVVGDGGLTFPPGDDAALASCLTRVLRGPGMAADLRERARRRALQVYSQHRMVTEHAALYRKLVPESRSQ